MSTAISVIVPTYNRAHLLGAAIASVYAQTCQDFELIVVDDGSTDDTARVVGQFDHRLKYLRTDHVGVARARNLGMASASGEFICYLDSDDLYYAHKLAAQLAYLRRHPDTVMVYTEFSAFDADGFRDEFHLRTYHKSAYRRPAMRYADLFDEHESLRENPAIVAAAVDHPHWLAREAHRGRLFDAFLQDTIVFTNSMMFRRSLLSSVGLQDPYFGHFHDQEFALRLCAAGPVAFLDNPTYKLRYHPGQVSAIEGPEGAVNAARLQRGLLRIARRHTAALAARSDADRERADALLGRLFRAAAIPLLSYGGGVAHRRKYFPRRARIYLRRALAHGGRVRTLLFMSCMPDIARRLYFRLADTWRRMPDR